MNKTHSLLLVCSFFLFVNNAYTQEYYPTSEEKLAWKGRLVFEEVDGKDFFQYLKLVPRLKSLLSKKDFTRVTSQVVTTPITVEQGWLFYSGCTPHVCGDAIRIALNIHGNELLVGINHHIVSDVNKLKIYKNNAPNDVPNEVLLFINFTD